MLELQPFTKEKVYSTSASKDFHLFYVGRDDVHNILKYVLSRVTVSLYLNMFGFDDDELNAIIMEKARDPHITMLITHDKSQAGGKTEKALLASDLAQNPTAYNTSFVIGESSTGRRSGDHARTDRRPAHCRSGYEVGTKSTTGNKGKRTHTGTGEGTGGEETGSKKISLKSTGQKEEINTRSHRGKKKGPDRNPARFKSNIL